MADRLRGTRSYPVEAATGAVPFLGESEERFRSVFAHAPVGMALRSLSGRFLAVNRAFCTLTGYAEAELLATGFEPITHPDDLPGEVSSTARLITGEIPSYVIESRYVRKSGETAWVQESVTLLVDDAGRANTIVAVVQEVTDRRRAAEALRESEERYRSLIETAREIICTVDLEGRFTSFNEAFWVLTGWSREEWIGRTFAGLVHPDDLGACTAAFEAAVRGEIGPAVEHRLLMRSGAWLKVESTGTPQFQAGRVIGVLGLVRDVTARVQAEAALSESRRRLQALFHNALDAILLVDDQGSYVDANPAATSLLGYDRDQLLSMTSAQIVPPDYQPHANEILHPFERDGESSGDYRVLRKDGSVRDAEFRSVANILPGVHLAIVRDVTDRKRAEEELRRSQRRLEEAEAVAHVGSWEWDLTSNDLKWSDELYRLFGVRRGEFRPSYHSSLERVHPEDRGFIDDMCQKAAREGSDYAYDGRIVRPNGEVRFIHARGHAVREADGSLRRMIGIAQDITDRKRDEQARQALLERLISVHEEERARISRELHDGTGQALAALLVGLRRVQDARSLKDVHAAAARQRELVAQALDELGRLARGLRPPILDDLGLRAALERHVSDQAWLFGFRVDLDASGLGPRRLPRAVETALYRVAQEALANATRHADARVVRMTLERAQGSVRLAIADDGRGFEVERALEAAGHLGLHGIRERAELLGGRAEIRSRPGEGTTVTVVVPVQAGARHRRRAGK
jgi:PAS domain S-box-containing protein